MTRFALNAAAVILLALLAAVALAVLPVLFAVRKLAGAL